MAYAPLFPPAGFNNVSAFLGQETISFYIFLLIVFYQGGLSEAQNGYDLDMIPAYGPRDGQFF